ncbi:hypothetical protein NQ318_017390 [Aromia moschata]|uniref:Mos1 transposase HTH domain-containing protein n=1 Tax=Aromia moschata TaxID=1265417 RepID=A0AAV8Z2C9_9CUCU|nr:hypothetical protein NQ318_017390 [Aromia moschata]
MLSVQMEQRDNLKFLVKLGETFTEAYAMLKEVYGNECLSSTQVSEWFKRFKEGTKFFVVIFLQNQNNFQRETGFYSVSDEEVELEVEGELLTATTWPEIRKNFQ